MLVMKTSACSISRMAMSRASALSRLRTRLRLPRLSSSKGGWRGRGEPRTEANSPRKGSPLGGSILMTCAPQSPRIAAAEGPATHSPSSTTFTPSSGPGMPFSSPAAIRQLLRSLRRDGLYPVRRLSCNALPFTLRPPAVMPASAACYTGRQAVAGEDGFMPGYPRILVIDPDAESRAEVQRLLVNSRYVVVGGVGYDEEAPKLASEFKPQVVL